MSDAPKDRSRPLSVRFSDAEKARLAELAGGKPVSLYIRERALEGQTDRRRARPGPVKDGDSLGKLLGLLGQSRIASNLNQLAKAANQGSLPVTEETEADLRAACAGVFDMRLLLLQALGMRILDEVAASPPLSDLSLAPGAE